jgi:hypothetical protein
MEIEKGGIGKMGPMNVEIGQKSENDYDCENPMSICFQCEKMIIFF